MVNRGRKKGTVRFAFSSNNGVQSVLLAGDFTDWLPRRMKKQRDGLFVSILALPAGSYQYKFLVDGEWTADQDNPDYSINTFGTANSVVTVF